MTEGWHFGLLLSRLLTKGSFESSLIPIFFLVIRWTPSDFIDGVLESCWPFFVMGYFCCCCSDFFSRNVCVSASGVYTRCFRWTSPDCFWRCLPLPVSILVICLNESRLILSGTYFGFVFRFRCLYSLFVFQRIQTDEIVFRFRCLYSSFSLDESRLFIDCF